MLLAQPFFQPLLATLERLENRLGRRRQAALEDGQGEADGAFAAGVCQRLGAVEFLADVIGDVLVQFGFGVGECVAGGGGAAFGEQRCAVELEQLLLDQPAHEVGSIGGVDAVAELSLEAVAVEQGHE